MQANVRKFFAYFLVLCFGFFIGGGGSYPAPVQAQTVTNSDLIAQSPSPQTITNRFVSQAVEKVGGAVVRIDTERTVTQTNPFADDPFFRRFFGEDFLPNMPRERRLRGQGSGFIIDSDGMILTNAHVVQQADQVSVNLKDGRTFDGRVLGADPITDLAVIKVQGNDLPTVPLGDSDQVRVGDWAIAVGNPLGLDNTVTLGIISTLNRPSAKVGIPDKRLDFLQTDAAINPGNSGGPLLNDRGEVIGINTAIRADANGIGFAIPVNKAKDIYAQLSQGKKVSHPYIGIRMISLTPELAKEINRDPNAGLLIPEIEGVLVMQIQADTPAARSGLRRGDVITQIDGTRITSGEQLQRVVENSNVGQKLTFKVRRGDRVETLSLYPAELEEFS
ncbi:PDZ domain-containing protein [Euhalothece natronophila Z-M001]|uniref:PDZ domain-containing protein n=1 Tax=Euhalothece natronophila Z-M001 TaxID=522448 RepID=A0A5B8NQH5_9CHRO|nr:HhoA/HhoB/HtrA family serine endopeptidase [Euhalothece natronophila]QDZ41197.1 PDZ domain-containing protein [Euhalothece natronophila Z-M001]